MAEHKYLPLFTDNWVADTIHLSRLERGLYMDLLVLCWRSPDCRVPNEIAWLERKLQVADSERATLDQIIKEFMSSTGNYLYQKRLLKEFQYARAQSRKQSVRSKSRWNKEKGVCRGNADTHDSGNAPNLTYLNKEKEKEKEMVSKKEILPAQVPIFVDTPQWEAWKKARGGQSLPVTDIRPVNGGQIKRGWWVATEYPS